MAAWSPQAVVPSNMWWRDSASRARLTTARGLDGSGPHERSRMFTLEEQMAEVQREILLRKACYPTWVRNGKLTQAEASRQLQLMVEVFKTLHRIDVEQRQLSLFGSGQG